MKRIWLLISALCFVFLTYYGCETPYTGRLGPEDFNGWIESEENGFVCLWNGFDRICIKTIEGPAGKDGRDGRDGIDGKDGRDGRDGKDGQTFIAIKEVPLNTVVTEIVYLTTTEYVDREVLIPIVEERIVTEYVDREVPVVKFVDRVVQIIKEVMVEVPGETVYVEVPVIKEVPVKEIVEVVKTIYVTETDPISVSTGAIYTESGYHNPPSGYHAHEFTHTHDGATHTHRVIHPDGEKDDWDREHDGFSGLAHD